VQERKQPHIGSLGYRWIGDGKEWAWMGAQGTMHTSVATTRLDFG
jgi:hypothetical protein